MAQIVRGTTGQATFLRQFIDSTTPVIWRIYGPGGGYQTTIMPPTSPANNGWSATQGGMVGVPNSTVNAPDGDYILFYRTSGQGYTLCFEYSFTVISGPPPPPPPPGPQAPPC